MIKSSDIVGYSNELGESFRPLIKKKYVHATYGVAIAYVFADTFDKSYKSYQKDKSLVKSAIVGGNAQLETFNMSMTKISFQAMSSSGNFSRL